MGDVDHISYVRKGNRIIALYEHNFLRALFVNIGQTPLQIIPGRIFLVDLYTRILSCTPIDQLHDNRAVRLRILRSIRRRWLWNQRIQTLRRHRRDHHADHRCTNSGADRIRAE